jgi:glycerophosphoryl diester phosphodiesterase
MRNIFKLLLGIILCGVVLYGIANATIFKKNAVPIIAHEPSTANTDKHWHLYGEGSGFIIIAHGLGGLTNGSKKIARSDTQEAFQENYAKGIQVFEADFRETVDGKYIVSHSPGTSNILPYKKSISEITEAEFLSGKLEGKFTLLSMQNVLELLKEYPDIVVITDPKIPNEKFYETLAKNIELFDPKLYARIIPQVYSLETIEWASKYPFQEFIFTLYKTNLNDQQIIEVLKENPKIKGIAMPITRYSDELLKEAKKLDRHVFLHTLNDSKVIDDYRQKGITGIYTDFYFE